MTTTATPLLSISSTDQSRNAVGRYRIPDPCLDPLQLIQLEWSFRQWGRLTNRYEVRLERHRILIVFLLIRYTGAALHEVLSLNLITDLVDSAVFFRNPDIPGYSARNVLLAGHIAQEIRTALENPDLRELLTDLRSLNPSVVRHKFSERAEACGFPKELSCPEMIRWARVMELLRKDTPQREIEHLLGCSLPDLSWDRRSPTVAATRQTAQSSSAWELAGTTTERNCFFGNIVEVHHDTLQAQINLLTDAGHPISAMVTNDSAERLGLRPGRMVTAEVKAHSVNLQGRNPYATSSVDNCFSGEIVGITRGRVSLECIVHIGGGTNVHSLHSAHYAATLGLKVGKTVWVAFNSFAVLLHAN